MTTAIRSSDQNYRNLRREFDRINRHRGLRAFLVPLLTLILICAAIAFLQPRFLSGRAASSVLTDAAPMLLLVSGLLPVILIGGIDLSVATMASFAAVLFVILSPATGDIGIVLVLVICCLIGIIQGLVHAKGQIPSFVVSFGTFGMLYGVTHYISHATAAPLQASSLISLLGEKTAGLPHGFVAALSFAGLLAALIRFTRFGRDLYAVGCSERAAIVAGVRVVRLKCLAFAISALFAGFAGLLFLSQTGYSSPAMANSYLLPAIVGVVVGGTAISGGVGSVGAAIVGSLIAVMVRLGTVMVGISPAYQQILFGLMVLVSVSLTIDRDKIGIIK